MFSASLVQLGTTRNYIAVEEKFLGFVLVYELACTELHGSGSFVKRVDPFCAINRHDCVLRLGCHSVCPHCKHLDTFEFLSMVQVKRNIALHNRKLKSRGINLIQLAPSCRKKVASYEKLKAGQVYYKTPAGFLVVAIITGFSEVHDSLSTMEHACHATTPLI